MVEMGLKVVAVSHSSFEMVNKKNQRSSLNGDGGSHGNRRKRRKTMGDNTFFFLQGERVLPAFLIRALIIFYVI